MTKTKGNWGGFSKKTLPERLDVLDAQHLLSQDNLALLKENKGLSLDIANQLTENVLGTFSLPFSLAPNFLVDGTVFNVPMVTEEPSVVAAASFAAKIIKRSGGFKTTVHSRQMIGQVALYDVTDKAAAQKRILEHTEQLLSVANDAHPSIVKRGGGAQSLRVEEKEAFLIVYVNVDTKEAMGANMVNTMMEALVPSLEELSGGKSLMAILSNYATQALVTAECQVDLRYLSRNTSEAKKLARKFQMASQLAQVDTYRATTHNKGIFNGVDAVVLATGNDWRAIEAGANAYACKDGQYRGLSTWTFDEDKQHLHGQLTLPMSIATRGGSIGLNPTVYIAHELLGQPDAQQLAQIIVSVGLAQNFAAVKALTSTGIQAGHMKLQAKSLALLAGAKENEVTQVVNQLLQAPHMNLETAQAILKTLN